MKAIDRKSMETLEYAKIIKQLSEFTVSSLARKKAIGIQPLKTDEEVNKELEKTDDSVKILRLKGGLPIGTYNDVRPQLKRMEIGAVSSGQEIVKIGQLLKGTREIYEFLEELKIEKIRLAHLYQMGERIVVLPKLEKRIYTTLSESGEVLDSASQKLRAIRRSIRQTESRIRDRLNSIVRGSQAKYLTDSLITMRNDRFVIPVKADSRNVFGGVVHGQSSSGQTLYVEPQKVLDLNNRLKELASEEKYEIERILYELSMEVVDYENGIIRNLELLIEFDLLQAKALYARDIKATRPTVQEDNFIELFNARHPLIPTDEIVPNDIRLGRSYKTVIVTGPNTGGKTVILKTLGLLQLMGQAGLYLPVEEGSSIGVFNHVLSDIGDEQSIEQSLSTFSSHLTTIVSIFEVMDENSLVILDELGAGTDPQEGAALAISILDSIGAAGSFAMITSHYPELKMYGYNRADTMNASMEFDIKTLKPTYRFKMGIPGRSNAFEIAQRLGMGKNIIDNARELMTSESQNIDKMIRDLDDRQKEAEENSRDLRRQLVQAEKLHRELKNVHEDYLKEKEQLKKEAQAEANKIVDKTKRKADRIIDDLREKQLANSGNEKIKEHEFIEAKGQLSDLKKEEERLKKNKVLQKEKEKQAFKVGQSVIVHSLGQNGVLVEKEDGEWIVQMGMLKMKLPESDLTVSKEEEKKETKGSSYYVSTSSTRPELDLRGERVEAALSKLDQYLDQALLANYKKVTIIHGHGTGAVRKAVQEALNKNSRVKNYKAAPANQGGNGATIVEFG
ncbi:MAG: endonuclease MutS2 [Atopostipes suicloacalis]|nr:endonuclease MutS2 [Atopostipes suicloacalis]